MQNLVYHEFPLEYHKNDTILILGSIPSPKSREEQFYYAHPQNRFWRILATVFNEDTPISINDKKDFLKRHHIALWDVIASCEIEKASDTSIKNVTPNDINIILNTCPIQKIFTVGKVATKLYKKYCYPKTKVESIYLPSTSPANCAMKEDILIEHFKQIIEK